MTDAFDDTGPQYPPPPSRAGVPGFEVGVSPIGDVSAFDPWKVIASQYANSPILTSLVLKFTEALDQTGNLQAFFDNIWDIGEGANGYGLDVWGRIVGVSRVIAVQTEIFFGFANALPGVTTWNTGLNQGFWGGGAFYSGEPLTTNYTLSDEAFLLLIMAKAASNITNGSIPAVNQILLKLFPNRGNCFVQEGFAGSNFFGFAVADGSGNPTSNGYYGFGQAPLYGGQSTGSIMQAIYTFDFELSPVELSIITTSGVLPTAAGVQPVVIQNF
jgi:hypothetical protein